MTKSSSIVKWFKLPKELKRWEIVHQLTFPFEMMKREIILSLRIFRIEICCGTCHKKMMYLTVLYGVTTVGSRQV